MARRNSIKKYCLSHEKEFVTVELTTPLGLVLFHYIGDSDNTCVGPFTEAPPPPALTEEQWQTIIASEKEIA